MSGGEDKAKIGFTPKHQGSHLRDGMACCLSVTPLSLHGDSLAMDGDLFLWLLAYVF
jgi:hypothetical protein